MRYPAVAMPTRRFVPLAALTVLMAACGGSAAPASSAPASAKPAVSGASAASAKPAGSAAAGELTKMNIPFNAISVSQTALYVAVDAGLFKKYGLDVSTEFIANSPQLIAAMSAGQINVASAGQDAVINANLNGSDIAIIATGVEKVIFSIYGSSKLSKIEDLKGKKLGVTQLGASTDFVGRYVLRQAKLEPEKDVAILQMGGQPEIIAGLQGGSIDAGVLAPPITTQARKAGFKQLADLADYDLVFYQGPLDAKKSWLKEHPAEALNVVRGYLDGIATVNKDKQTAIQAISKYTKLTDAEALEEGYQAVVKSLPKVPLPKVDAIKTGLAENKSPAAKTADPASFIEPSLVDQLQKSGFIDSLYK